NCWVCQEGQCRLEGVNGAWTGCKPGCDFRGYEYCDPTGVAGAPAVELELYAGFAVTGSWIRPDAFAELNCGGAPVAVHYTPEGAARRQAIAKAIVLDPRKHAEV